MNNLYVLRKQKGRTLRKVAAVALRCGVILGLIGLLACWAGVEFGPLMIGKRLIWSAAGIGFIALCGWIEGRLD